jgi:hypothetical protein
MPAELSTDTDCMENAINPMLTGPAANNREHADKLRNAVT